MLHEITLNNEETVHVTVNNITFVIKHNDVGASIDLYTDLNGQPERELQYWFEDFEAEDIEKQTVK